MTLAAYRVYEQITPGGQMPPGLWWVATIATVGCLAIALGYYLGGGDDARISIARQRTWNE
jgi:hypothetical protein